MKAVILSSGTCPLHNIDSVGRVVEKPRCLYHVNGEVLLERQVRLLQKHRIQDIRIVVGYKKEMIEQFNEEKKLDLEIVYDLNWMLDKSDETMKIGVKEIDDDLLIVCGDSYFTEKFLESFLAIKHSIVVTGIPRRGINLSKIAKEKLEIFDEYDEYYEKCFQEIKRKNESLLCALSDLLDGYQAVFFSERNSRMPDCYIQDIDYINETDEDKFEDA